MKTPDFTLEEVKEYLHSETHYIEAVGNFKNAILDHIEQLEVKAKLVEQYRWERDTAIDQLKQLGVGFGEKVNGKLPRWISVEERLPENYISVIGYLPIDDKEGLPPTREVYRTEKGWFAPSLGELCIVTHWMSMPEGFREV